MRSHEQYTTTTTYLVRTKSLLAVLLSPSPRNIPQIDVGTQMFTYILKARRGNVQRQAFAVPAAAHYDFTLTPRRPFRVEIVFYSLFKCDACHIITYSPTRTRVFFSFPFLFSPWLLRQMNGERWVYIYFCVYVYLIVWRTSMKHDLGNETTSAG